MVHRMFRFLLPVFLVPLLLGTISCSSDDNPVNPVKPPPAADRRSPFINVILESSNTVEAVSLDRVSVHSNYGTPWNPNGGPVPMVVVGIDGCSFKLNNRGPLTPIEDNNYSESEYLLEGLTGFNYNPPQPIHFQATIPSEEDAYPEGYPSFTVNLPTEEVEIELPNLTPYDPSGAIVWPPAYMSDADGNFIRFVLHRNSDMDESLRTVAVDEEYIWTNGGGADVVWSQVRFVNPDEEGNVDIYIAPSLRGEANVLRVTLRFTAYAATELTEIVEGKTAVVSIHEEMLLTRDCPIDSTAPGGW